MRLVYDSPNPPNAKVNLRVCVSNDNQTARNDSPHTRWVEPLARHESSQRSKSLQTLAEAVVCRSLAPFRPRLATGTFHTGPSEVPFLWRQPS
jgi:hypothetical protein